MSDNFQQFKSAPLKPIADIDEPVTGESAVENSRKIPKTEEVEAELEPIEDEFEAEAENEEEKRDPEHKVIKYGEYKKPKKIFGEAEQ